MKKRSIKKIFIIILCITGLDFIGAYFYFQNTADSFEKKVINVPAGIVLINDFNGETRTVGVETQRRLHHAIQLYNEGAIDHIICVGGARPRVNVFGAELMREFLLKAQIPDEKILFEKKSYDSKTNWWAAQGIVNRQGWDKVALISSSLHLYRFKNIVEKSPSRDVQVYYFPYDIRQAQPKVFYIDLWKEIHYEWIAQGANFLPKSIYKKLIENIRAQ